MEDFPQAEGQETILRLSGMYQNWFLDYASYVILERAVPALEDGFKPVQRRIMHSMDELEDGRYNKVANIVGNTMKYHPHGDASIGDAIIQLGQKQLLIDTQGSWGNILTGDDAAAPRYIEARLSKFALDVLFSPKVTEWQKSYDGRNDEPVHLPVKFPWGFLPKYCPITLMNSLRLQCNTCRISLLSYIPIFLQQVSWMPLPITMVCEEAVSGCVPVSPRGTKQPWLSPRYPLEQPLLR